MGSTEPLRQKETEEDYGYIFDPDLTRQELDEELQEEIRESLPELPQEKFERFQEEYGLKDKLVESLVTEAELADDFEELAEKFDADLVASWMTGELKKTLNYWNMAYGDWHGDYNEDSTRRMKCLSTLLEYLENEDISDRAAEKALQESVEYGLMIEEVVEEEDLLKAEEDEISEFVEAAIEENPDAVEDYESGEEEAVNFLVGQVMQKSQGKADPKTAREKIVEELE
jgi:aspartyl-tRNA(Asn)/glutamyl-tRNA(Gln) amidotransferase subunit B